MITRYFQSGHEVLRDTLISEGGYDGPVYDEQTVATVDGRISELAGDERLSADKLTLYATHKLYTGAGANILVTDKIRKDGRVYRVKNIRDPMQMGKFLVVDLELVE